MQTTYPNLIGLSLPVYSFPVFLASALAFPHAPNPGPSKQVSNWENVQLQECLWAGEWGLGEAVAGP